MFCSCIFTKRHSHNWKNDCYRFHFPLVFISPSLFISYNLLLAFNIINSEALLIFLLSFQNCSFSLLVQTFVFFLFPICFTLFPFFLFTFFSNELSLVLSKIGSKYWETYFSQKNGTRYLVSNWKSYTVWSS